MYKDKFICFKIEKHPISERFVASFKSIKKDEGYTANQINIWLDKKDKNKFKMGNIYNLSINE